MYKKIIVFDLDETLRELEFDKSWDNVINVTLRPNIEELLKKLQEVKEQGIDVAIWTTASSASAKKYFIDCLPEQYRGVFDRIISRDNNVVPEKGSKEEKVYENSIGNKPVTSLEGYDQILFFDNNKTEIGLLENVFREDDSEQTLGLQAPNKQVMFCCYEFNPPEPAYLYALKKLSEGNTEIAKLTNELLGKVMEEPGCSLMIEKIEEFQKSEFKPGLVSDVMNETMNAYKLDVDCIDDEIDDLMTWEEGLSNKYYKYSEEFFDVIAVPQKEKGYDR